MDPENPDDPAVAQLALAAHNDASPIFRLPVELIDYIYQLAYHHLGPNDDPFDPPRPRAVHHPSAHRPLCRRLYPVQQYQLYGHLETTSIRALYLVERTFAEDTRGTRRRLADCVERLSLGSPERRDWAMLAYTDRVQTLAQQNGRPNYLVPVGEAPKLLVSLLGELSRLESLYVFLGGMSDVGDPDEVAMLRLIFTDPSTLVYLESVKEVRFDTYGPVLDAAFLGNAGAWLDRLGRLPQLETLKLNFCARRMPTIFQAPSLARPVLKMVRSLKIRAPTEFWRAPLRLLMPQLASLKIYSAQDSSGSAGLRSFLESAPPGLLDLVIISYGSHAAVDDLFPTFPHLRSLHLGASCCDLVRLPSALARLADLKILHLGRGAILPKSTLLGLVTGPHRLESLRKLILDYIDCVEVCFGSTLRSRGGELPLDEERDASGLWGDWERPAWPQGCSEVIIGGVVSAARAHGIVVAGTAVRALDWVGEYVAARDAVARRRGVERGDWHDARRFLGARIVELLKEEQQAARGWPEGFAGALLRC